MPTTKRQITANQENAKKSTGPKTKKGKQIARQNRTIHGLRSKESIINSPTFKEDPKQYQNLLLSLSVQLNPIGQFEQALVKRIADCLWRSKRAIRAETAQINNQLSNVEDTLNLSLSLSEGVPTPKEKKQLRDNIIGARLIPNAASCLNIIRYEMRLDRQLTRAYRLLVHIQTMRKLETADEHPLIPPPTVQTQSDQTDPANGHVQNHHKNDSPKT